MTHKVHPKAFRIRAINDWGSRGFYKKDLYSKYLKEDFEIRKFLNKKLAKIGIDSIEIERFSTKISIIINTARPGLIIGRRGEGVEELKRDLDKIVKDFSKNKNEYDWMLPAIIGDESRLKKAAKMVQVKSEYFYKEAKKYSLKVFNTDTNFERKLRDAQNYLFR